MDVVPTSRMTFNAKGATSTYEWAPPDVEEWKAAYNKDYWKCEKYYLPFHERGLLFEMVAKRYRDNEIQLTKEPCRPTFYAVIRQEHVANRLVFLRHVILGRCPTCIFYKTLIQKTISTLRVQS